MLLPGTPLLEIFVRGTLTYLALFLILRFVLRREVGQLGITDILVVVLIADAAQNAMGDSYQSVPDGIALVLVIALWALLIDWGSHRWRRFERFAKPRPRVIVKDGRILREPMDRELITDEELFSVLREHGITDLGDVSRVTVESEGNISVISRGRGVAAGRERP